jgi:hypothetical protein
MVLSCLVLFFRDKVLAKIHFAPFERGLGDDNGRSMEQEQEEIFGAFWLLTLCA